MRELNDSYLKVLFNGELALLAFPFGRIHAGSFNREMYVKSADSIMRETDSSRSYDEYGFLCDQKSLGGRTGGLDSFKILRWFTEQLLVLNSSAKPRVDIRIQSSRASLWNNVFRELGQDLFTCSYVASKVLEGSLPASGRFGFDWPSVILSNDDKLNDILSRGIAENHFHLEASTQIFPLTWACMMNYPLDVCRKLGKEGMHEGFEFEEEAESEESEETGERSKEVRKFYDTWIKNVSMESPVGRKRASDADLFGMIRNAAILRVLLYQKLWMPGKDILSVFNQYRADPYALDNWTLIDDVRVGVDTGVSEEKKRLKYLDYTISDMFYNVNPELPGRLLTGERSFLYHCFVEIFSDQWGDNEKDLFFAYLLLKMKIRKRYIDTDARRGFFHFKTIQDKKKEAMYAQKGIYSRESYRLSVLNSLMEYPIYSLEARIMSKDNPSALKTDIKNIDSQIIGAEKSEDNNIFDKYGLGKKELTEGERTLDRIFKVNANYEEETGRNNLEDRYFFTVHISREGNPNKKEAIPMDEQSDISKNNPILRNNDMRKKARRAVKALDKYFNGWPKCEWRLINAIRENERRIYGLDVCSFEAECRPNIFATDFRFIRAIDNNCGLTYHVGEDYESVINGLRAVDEAIYFLELQDGDRLGHALALGMDVKQLLKYRIVETGGRVIYLRKQDILDDLIWLLFRTREFRINIEENLWKTLWKTAVELFQFIFKEEKSFDGTRLSDKECLEKYYYSWKLRGDHPFLYRTMKYSQSQEIVYSVEYNMCMKSGNVTDAIREDRDIAYLCYLYHYSESVKKRGDKKEIVSLSKFSDTLLGLITQMQLAICREAAQRGISIECNPTSNYCIAGMKSYKEHPIDVFCKVKPESSIDSIKVSINTDDLGVFDTSLPHEYLVVKEALTESRKYSDEEIYSYLEQVRKMGIDMSFH